MDNSDVVKVTIVRSGPSCYVFPNPVTYSKIQLQLSNAQAGIYNTRLLSSNGQLISNKVIAHSGRTATHSIRPSQALTAGKYQLKVTGPDKKSICDQGSG